VQQAAMQIPISPNASNRRAFTLDSSSNREIDAVERVGKVDSSLIGDHTIKAERSGWSADKELGSNPPSASNISAPLADRSRMAIENMCTEGNGAIAESGSVIKTSMPSSMEAHLKNYPTASDAEREYQMQLYLLGMQCRARCRKQALPEIQTTADPSLSSEIPMNSHDHQPGSASVVPENDKYPSENQADHGGPASSSSSPSGGHRLQDYQNALMQHEQSRGAQQALSPMAEIRNLTVTPPLQLFGHRVPFDQQSKSPEQESANSSRPYHQGEQNSVAGSVPQIPQKADYQADVSRQELLARLQKGNEARMEAARRETENHNSNFPNTIHPVKVDSSQGLTESEQEKEKFRTSYEQQLKILEQQNKVRQEAVRRGMENHNSNVPATNPLVIVDYQQELEELEKANKRRRKMKENGIGRQEAVRREVENHNSNVPAINPPVKVDYQHELMELEKANKRRRMMEENNMGRQEAVRREVEDHNSNVPPTNPPVKVDYQYELMELEKANKRRRMMEENSIGRQQENPTSSTAANKTFEDESNDLEAIEAQIQVLQEEADRIRSLKRSHASSVLQ
jgi:hypothetical protein